MKPRGSLLPSGRRSGAALRVGAALLLASAAGCGSPDRTSGPGEPGGRDAGRGGGGPDQPGPDAGDGGGVRADGGTGDGVPCDRNSDCPLPLICGRSGECIVECVANGDCDRGEVCAQGSCAADADVSTDGAGGRWIRVAGWFVGGLDGRWPVPPDDGADHRCEPCREPVCMP